MLLVCTFGGNESSRASVKEQQRASCSHGAWGGIFAGAEDMIESRLGVALLGRRRMKYGASSDSSECTLPLSLHIQEGTHIH